MNLRDSVTFVTGAAILAIGIYAAGTSGGPPAPTTAGQANTESSRKGLTEVTRNKTPALTPPKPAASSPRGKKRAPKKQIELASLPDPFGPLRPASDAPSANLPRIEQLELSQLRLVAIVRDIEGRIGASVEDSHGIGFFLRPGSHVGPHGGFVRDITAEAVTIYEPSGSGEHRGLAREVSLTLRPPHHPAPH